MKEKHFYVYIATNCRNTVLYTGVTNSLSKRIFQHKSKLDNNSFTAKYNIEKIIYYEIYGSVGAAIYREKQIKAGSRKDKMKLINSMNPEQKNLLAEL